eukprot:7434300-Pyramimonas_sp.AAC.1
MARGPLRSSKPCRAWLQAPPRPIPVASMMPLAQHAPPPPRGHFLTEVPHRLRRKAKRKTAIVVASFLFVLLRGLGGWGRRVRIKQSSDVYE